MTLQDNLERPLSTPETKPGTCPFSQQGKAGRPKVDEAFRNFGPGGLPLAEEIQQWPSRQPLAVQTLIRKLIRRMSEPHRFADHSERAGSSGNNPRIPAGYTYLAQLAGHDIVHSAVPGTRFGIADLPRDNLRTRPLMLETIYGRGPSGDPGVYERPPTPRGQREKLRLGDIRLSAAQGTANTGLRPFTARDIPRNWTKGPGDTAPGGRPEVPLPDPRNDGNVIISQLTALFHHLHNAAIRRLEADTYFSAQKPDDLLVYRRFALAQRLTEAAYRQILIRDLLRRLLKDGVWQHYETNAWKPLVDKPDGRVPLEFSDAAYRLGHAMVRQTYRFSQAGEIQGIRNVIMASSKHRPRETPIHEKWVAEWSQYFEIERAEQQPQPSRRIGPSYNRILMYDSLFPNHYEPGGSDRPDGSLSGLLFRDLVRGFESGLRSVASLAAILPDNMRAQSRLLDDPEYRTRTLQGWLTTGANALDREDAQAIAADPPLLFYLLFEAAHEADGKSLGTLGSIITADVFAGALRQSRPFVEDAYDATLEATPWTTTGQGLKQLFGEDVPQTMGELILFVAEELKLNAVRPRFI